LASSMFLHWPYHYGSSYPWWSSPLKIFRDFFVIVMLLVCSLWGNVSSIRIKHIFVKSISGIIHITKSSSGLINVFWLIILSVDAKQKYTLHCSH
jgi:hypothetical protein